MKTTQKQAAAAYRALQEIGTLPFPVRDALALLRAKKQLETAWEFQCQEEGKLAAAFRPQVKDGKYVMTYERADEEGEKRAREFAERMRELQELETEIAGEPARVRVPGDEVRIRPETLAALEGFVEWEEADT